MKCYYFKKKATNFVHARPFFGKPNHVANIYPPPTLTLTPKTLSSNMPIMNYPPQLNKITNPHLLSNGINNELIQVKNENFLEAPKYVKAFMNEPATTSISSHNDVPMPVLPSAIPITNDTK